jgi:hypothetical protein
MSILALLSNYDQENCLINIGTEGRMGRRLGKADRQVQAEAGRTPQRATPAPDDLTNFSLPQRRLI